MNRLKDIALHTGLALFLVVCGSNSSAQVLLNPSFENAPQFYPAPATPDYSLSEVDQGWAIHGFIGQADMGSGAFDGSHGLLEQAVPGINWNPDVAYQIVSGVMVGDKYEFDISYLTDTGFTGSFYPNVALEIGFLDSSLNDIGTVENPTPFASFSYPIQSKNIWCRGSASGTAPVGSKYIIVFAIFMDNGQTTTEDVYFDGATLSIVPEPGCFALSGLGLAVGMLRRCKQTRPI